MIIVKTSMVMMRQNTAVEHCTSFLCRQLSKMLLEPYIPYSPAQLFRFMDLLGFYPKELIKVQTTIYFSKYLVHSIFFFLGKIMGGHTMGYGRNMAITVFVQSVS